jgi:hypothetical protein
MRYLTLILVLSLIVTPATAQSDTDFVNIDNTIKIIDVSSNAIDKATLLIDNKPARFARGVVGHLTPASIGLKVSQGKPFLKTVFEEMGAGFGSLFGSAAGFGLAAACVGTFWVCAPTLAAGIVVGGLAGNKIGRDIATDIYNSGEEIFANIISKIDATRPTKTNNVTKNDPISVTSPQRPVRTSNQPLEKADRRPSHTAAATPQSATANNASNIQPPSQEAVYNVLLETANRNRNAYARFAGVTLNGCTQSSMNAFDCALTVKWENSEGYYQKTYPFHWKRRWAGTYRYKKMSGTFTKIGNTWNFKPIE